MFEEEPEGRYVSYEKYDDLRSNYEQLENNYHNLNFKYEELISKLQETLESKNTDLKIGELYEWCKENKYF